MDNTTTTTYTFTPDPAGPCAVPTTMTVTVNPVVTPTFTAVAPICAGDALAALPTTSAEGITGSWLPAVMDNTATTLYTFTPDAGQCAVTNTMTVTVTPNVTPTFVAVTPICAGDALAALPTTSTEGITGSWSPAVMDNTTTTLYTFTPDAGQCAVANTMTITVNPVVTPTFTPVAPICAGGSLAALPTMSIEGVTGTWSPPLDNTTTTLYTFMPDAGQCAPTATMTITVNPSTTPTFNAVAPICTGEPLAALPTNSTEGIAGTWSPAVMDNTETTTYIFTPDPAGPCALTTTMTITVNQLATSTFAAMDPICLGDTSATLPATSVEGFTGVWSPAALDYTNTTTYTFTPDAGQCAAEGTLTVDVIENVTPTFNDVAKICPGEALTALPKTSLNGITGTWSPPLDNMATTTYTFTPDAGQCATSKTLEIVVSSDCDIPRGISPNNDGLNDELDLTEFNVNKLSIFNRYGVKVYNYGAGYTKQWHGQSDAGQELPDGTYYYVINMGTDVTKTGWIYINREQ
ncbi:hypothetical protein FEDK69T_31260 [Flavobacterium enshiense DK69]|nr:hypothetical protein FEDK69T_31260 [Flavobacterium enshiense DK69]